MSEFRPKDYEQTDGFGFDNARDFLGWMFPAAPADVIQGLTEDRLTAIYEILIEHAQVRFKNATDARHKKLIQMPFDSTKLWFAGNTIQQIADARGLNEGSIRIGITGHASRLGEVEDLDDLIAESDSRIEAKLASMAEQADAVIQQSMNEELQTGETDELLAPDAGIGSSEPIHVPASPSHERAARIAVQNTIAEPAEKSEPKILPMNPKELERLIDEFPMLRDMSPEAVAEVAKNLKLT